MLAISYLLFLFIKEENEFITSDAPESKTKPASNSIVAQARTLQQKKEKITKNANQAQSDENKPTVKNDEWKAIELYLARSAAKQNTIYSMLNGNEDTTFIYGFISQTPTKYAYKELIKFRKRTSYMELLVYFLQKGMSEELNTDIREWCVDTQEWIQRRNVAILGNRSIVTKKAGGVVTVAGNQQLTSSFGDFGDDGDKKGLKGSSGSQIGNFTTFKKRKIKKYKLLIPLELDGPEKVKMEDKQKAAIDKIYDLFPEMHEQWMRRKRLRRLTQEESAFKAQYYNIWGLNEFSLLMSRIQQTSSQNETLLFNNEYIEPQQFLFDTSNCMLLSEENRYNKELFKIDEVEKAELLPVPPNGKPKAGAAKKQSTVSIKAPRLRQVSKTPSKASKVTKHLRSSTLQDKILDIKDTCELLADTFYGFDVPDENENETKSTATGLTAANLNASNKSSKNVTTNPPSRFTNFTNLSNQVILLSFREIVENLRKTFSKFNQAIVG